MDCFYGLLVLSVQIGLLVLEIGIILSKDNKSLIEMISLE